MSVVGDITMSVDGFVTGPDPGVDAGLGHDAEGLHAWALDSDDPVDRAMVEELTAASGAVVMGRHTFDVVDGPAAAISRAREAAGDRDVYVMGGGRLVGSCLALGLLDRLQLHLSPEVLGAGTPLFAEVGRHRLRQRQVRVSPAATHLFYDVV